MSQCRIHRRAVANRLRNQDLRLRSTDEGIVAVDPARAKWRYLSFATHQLTTGATIDVGGPTVESAIILVAGGGAVLAEPQHERLSLSGRTDQFAALASGWYLPPGKTATLSGLATSSSATTLVAIASAPSSGRAGVATEILTVGQGAGRVETRGTGNATRQIHHIIEPDFPADRLELVEVFTPSGNWSSWPPHKHDTDDMPEEAVLEEIYYYGFPREEAWGIQRVYRADRSRDALWEVRTGDVVLVTDGYHPFTAGHGDNAWYLNALAGDRRTMACSFDPDLAWVRDVSSAEEPDPRVPLVRG